MDHSAAFLTRLLDVVEQNVLPVTTEAVREGNKLFGAAIIAKKTHEVICVGTNLETEWPLLHGEVSCLRNYNAIPFSERPDSKDCVFVATHEPCSLCLSAITWAGFDNFYFLFSYADTKDAFNIPHDLQILQEVFRCNNGEYARRNAFWSSYSIEQLVQQLGDSDEQSGLTHRVASLRETYNALSDSYQASKGAKNIPLA